MYEKKIFIIRIVNLLSNLFFHFFAESVRTKVVTKAMVDIESGFLFILALFTFEVSKTNTENTCWQTKTKCQLLLFFEREL